MSLTIRPATPEDAAAVLSLLRRLAAFEGSPEGIRMTEETFRRDGFGPERRFEALLALSGGRICGLTMLLRVYSSWAAAPTLTVHDLFVEDDARGLGAGRALLAAAARLARNDGCCRMDVNVLAWNSRAREFYETLGFAPLPDWLPYRLDAAGLAALAGDEQPDRLWESDPARAQTPT